MIDFTKEFNPEQKAMVKAAIQIATFAATEYNRQNGLTPPVNRLVDAIFESVRDDINIAIEDASEAYAVGMEQVGFATFRASMVLSGIKAAKRCDQTN